jgi:hypothetical protein
MFPIRYVGEAIDDQLRLCRKKLHKIHDPALRSATLEAVKNLQHRCLTPPISPVIARSLTHHMPCRIAQSRDRSGSQGRFLLWHGLRHRGTSLPVMSAGSCRLKQFSWPISLSFSLCAFWEKQLKRTSDQRGFLKPPEPPRCERDIT